MREKRIELSQRERDRLKVLHQVEQSYVDAKQLRKELLEVVRKSDLERLRALRRFDSCRARHMIATIASLTLQRFHPSIPPPINFQLRVHTRDWPSGLRPVQRVSSRNCGYIVAKHLGKVAIIDIVDRWPDLEAHGLSASY